jgi:hypothetical protein
MYAEHLKQYSEYFDASQFLVIPSYYYYQAGPGSDRLTVCS